MKIHHEGYSIILTTIILALVFVAGIGYLVHWHSTVLVFLVIFALGFLGLVLWFFRVPHRTVEANNKIVYAPADGKIVAIEETIEEEYFKDKRIQVSIFMSPLNVHANFYPFSGEVQYYKYHPGKYLVAWHPKSSTLNERTTIVLKDSNGKEVLIRQIAGAVARRIICYSKEGEQVEQGEELGFIKFGSRVDVFLPLGTDIKVAMEDISVAKRTVLAEF